MKQATRKSVRRRQDTNQRAAGRSALDEVSFLYRVLYDRYVELLKRHFRKHDLDDLLRPGFGYVLFALFEDEVLRPSEICRRTGIKASTLTAIVDRMVEMGLVDRRPDDDDRRAIQLRLLPKARQTREANYRVLDETTETICRGIPQRDLQIAKRVMRQMIENMTTGQ